MFSTTPQTSLLHKLPTSLYARQCQVLPTEPHVRPDVADRGASTSSLFCSLLKVFSGHISFLQSHITQSVFVSSTVSYYSLVTKYNLKHCAHLEAMWGMELWGEGRVWALWSRKGSIPYAHTSVQIRHRYRAHPTLVCMCTSEEGLRGHLVPTLPGSGHTTYLVGKRTGNFQDLDK